MGFIGFVGFVVFYRVYIESIGLKGFRVWGCRFRLEGFEYRFTGLSLSPQPKRAYKRDVLKKLQPSAACSPSFSSFGMSRV